MIYSFHFLNDSRERIVLHTTSHGNNLNLETDLERSERPSPGQHWQAPPPSTGAPLGPRTAVAGPDQPRDPSHSGSQCNRVRPLAGQAQAPSPASARPEADHQPDELEYLNHRDGVTAPVTVTDVSLSDSTGGRQCGSGPRLSRSESESLTELEFRVTYSRFGPAWSDSESESESDRH